MSIKVELKCDHCKEVQTEDADQMWTLGLIMCSSKEASYKIDPILRQRSNTFIASKFFNIKQEYRMDLCPKCILAMGLRVPKVEEATVESSMDDIITNMIEAAVENHIDGGQ